MYCCWNEPCMQFPAWEREQSMFNTDGRGIDGYNDMRRWRLTRLSPSLHQNHISTRKRQLDRFRLWWRRCVVIRRDWFMLHEKVSLGTQRKWSNSWQSSKEFLVIRMVRYAVWAGDIVVDQTEVELASCCSFGWEAEIIQTFGNWTWCVFGVILIFEDCLLRFRVYNLAIWWE